MNGLTNYITDQSWEDTITRWYILIDDAAQQILARSARPLRASGPPPTFTDSEVITVALIIESFFQGHEDVGYAFVRQYLRPLFPRLLDLDRFNARRRDLLGLIEAIRRALRDQILAGVCIPPSPATKSLMIGWSPRLPCPIPKRWRHWLLADVI
jgi:hypothetical protein